MEPRIQYAKTKDGVSIAFWTLGEGEPLLHVPLAPLTHTQMSWQIPEYRRWLEGLAQKRMLVFWDWRGCGLSDRLPVDFSMDASILDLEAVARSVGADRFALFAMFASTPLALTYAARHPQRVSHLVLWHGIAGFLEQAASGVAAVQVGKVDQDVWAQMVAPIVVGQEAPAELTRQVSTLLREAVEGTALALLLDQSMLPDATALLPQVNTPTLILHRREHPMVSLDVARGLATRIAGSQLVVLEGDAFAPFAGDTEAVLEAIDEFLGEGEEAKAAPKVGEGLQTILFTDVEGSTALTQRLGDAKARDLLREHERMVREALKSHGGAEVKTMGDGFMASFSSATKALECAIAMQRAFAEHNETRRGGSRTAPTTEPIRVRIGLNAGEPIAEDDPDGRSDLFGTAVNEAARITATAKGGEILVSNVVRELVKGKDFLFTDRGETSLKGFDEPVRLYEVRWQEEG